MITGTRQTFFTHCLHPNLFLCQPIHSYLHISTSYSTCPSSSSSSSSSSSTSSSSSSSRLVSFSSLSPFSQPFPIISPRQHPFRTYSTSPSQKDEQPSDSSSTPVTQGDCINQTQPNQQSGPSPSQGSTKLENLSIPSSSSSSSTSKSPSFPNTCSIPPSKQNSTNPSFTTKPARKLDPNVVQLLSSWRRSLLAYKSKLASELEHKFSLLGSKINQITGYNDVELLKRQVAAKENELETLRELARKAKIAYDEAVAFRSTTQRQVNSLLERKHSWTDSDVATFTSLIRSDHSSSSIVSTASANLNSAETAVDHAFTALTRAILERYHEEQVWSDKIRSVSTWAGIAAIVINLIVFIGAIAFVEPWKRRKLVSGLEERVSGMMDRLEKGMGEVASRIDKLEDEVKLTEGIGSKTIEIETEIASESDQIKSSIFAPTTLPHIPYRFTWLQPYLPAQLKPMTEPSHERDLGFFATSAAITCVLLGWILRGFST